MNSRYWALFGGILGLTVSLVVNVAGQGQPAQDNSPPQDGVTVLARGPVHEAYAEPSEVQPQATPLVTKQPPDPIEEVPPDQKPDGDNVQWIPGYWQWDADSQ